MCVCVWVCVCCVPRVGLWINGLCGSGMARQGKAWHGGHPHPNPIQSNPSSSSFGPIATAHHYHTFFIHTIAVIAHPSRSQYQQRPSSSLGPPSRCRAPQTTAASTLISNLVSACEWESASRQCLSPEARLAIRLNCPVQSRAHHIRYLPLQSQLL